MISSNRSTTTNNDRSKLTQRVEQKNKPHINMVSGLSEIVANTDSNNRSGTYFISQKVGQQNNGKSSLRGNKEIQISEFRVEEMQQNEAEHNNDGNKENIESESDNKKLLQNITRIITCKKQAQSLISQILVYMQIISSLKKQNKNYRTQIQEQNKISRELRDIVHNRDMEILELREERDRMGRMLGIEREKVRALRELERRGVEERWGEIFRNQLQGGGEGQQQEQYYGEEEGEKPQNINSSPSAHNNYSIVHQLYSQPRKTPNPSQTNSHSRSHKQIHPTPINPHSSFNLNSNSNSNYVSQYQLNPERKSNLQGTRSHNKRSIKVRDYLKESSQQYQYQYQQQNQQQYGKIVSRNCGRKGKSVWEEESTLV